MRLSQFLNENAILVDFKTQDKWEAIQHLTDRLIEIGSIPKESKDTVHAALVAREKSMSTGMEKGIAIPHAAVDGIPDLAVSLGVLPKGVAFESIDGQPATIVVLLVIPRSKKLNHIRTLAEVARILSHDALRKKILAATTPAAVYAAIQEEEETSPAH